MKDAKFRAAMEGATFRNSPVAVCAENHDMLNT